MKKTRNRRIKSVGNELLLKSREAGLASVQIFNNPQITFKSELYIVLMVIAWTYLLHSYYRKKKIEYRYFRLVNGKRVFDRTKAGAQKHWELARCLNESSCPLDSNSINNLKFLIGLRHEIEHQMTMKIDPSLSAKFQACCLNFNKYIKVLFGDRYGIDKHLSFSLQFSSINRDHAEQLTEATGLPAHIKSYISKFEGDLSEQEYNSQEFAYRVLFVAKTANQKGQADQVIEFVKADSPLVSEINKSYAVIKETERPKLLPSDIVKRMKTEGFPKFRTHEHTTLWKKMDAKNPAKGFGVQVSKAWYWYESWLEIVRSHCKDNPISYS